MAEDRGTPEDQEPLETRLAQAINRYDVSRLIGALKLAELETLLAVVRHGADQPHSDSPQSDETPRHALPASDPSGRTDQEG